MTGYLLRRVLQSVVVVVLVAVVTFVLLQLLPGGPARAILGPKATAEQIETFTRQNGYDKPVAAQFLRWAGGVLHGDLGYSYKLNQPVLDVIDEHLPKTIVLMALSTTVALVLAVPIGIYQARKRNTLGDYAVTALSFAFYAMPSFFLGELLILLFAIQLHWFSPVGPNGDTLGAVFGQASSLVLPVATLALITVASFSRYVRSSVMENLSQDYVRTALAGGAGDGRVLLRHVLRNSLIPVVTLLGITLPQLFAGALITEQVFNYPGMGFVFVQGAQVHDYPILLGIGLMVAVATVVGSLLADVGYAVLDPRVTY
ncbi:ABC transporter permease [Nocardia terpenica]|uniref:ABC transporter permease n=1 Tax=Nocardia terpenica TaxID=455432 RepID=UPI0018947371|nr:ABC transporter permease [Nocardia terpenica]MBF6061310.1 ABC transporter permease [Nocardia terpenica]MBF6105461.1 ABC transporter permease [Nocardia terpenica]MBF6113069.1 ABC transporter permease [Nocardia terpenica]MBF6119199.1 ABC transporter permease [Nocardia terpenica]MBF6152847.1 ABC transporter permease [Nocardia terpenica]